MLEFLDTRDTEANTETNPDHVAKGFNAVDTTAVVAQADDDEAAGEGAADLVTKPSYAFRCLQSDIWLDTHTPFPTLPEKL
jgi:hypothetical protein